MGFCFDLLVVVVFVFVLPGAAFAALAKREGSLVISTFPLLTSQDPGIATQNVELAAEPCFVGFCYAIITRLTFSWLGCGLVEKDIRRPSHSTV